MQDLKDIRPSRPSSAMVWVVSLAMWMLSSCSQRVMPDASMPSEAELRVLERRDGATEDPVLTKLEYQLGLGAPVNVRSPTYLDPYWWFTYLKSGMRLELATLPVDMEHPPPFEIYERAKFRYCPPLYWLGPAGKLGGPRQNDQGAASRTFRIRLASECVDQNAIVQFLGDLDMTKLVTIPQIEWSLGLGNPHDTGAGSSSIPMISLTYVKEDYIIELFAQETGDKGEEADASWADDRSRLAFTGYWRVFKKQDTKQRQLAGVP